MNGWRARTFYLTRNRAFLWKGAAIILGFCVGFALLISAFNRSSAEPDNEAEDNRVWQEEQRDSFNRIMRDNAKPDDVADWIREVASEREEASKDWAFDPAQLRIGEFDLAALIARHLSDTNQRELFGDFARCFLIRQPKDRKASEMRIHVQAMKSIPIRYANEFLGDIAAENGQTQQALAAYVKEGAFPEAKHARSMAWKMAIHSGNKDKIAKMLADERFVREADAGTIFHAAEFIKDHWLMLRTLAAYELSFWHGYEVGLALLAGALWYVLIIYGTTRERGRWLIYLLPVLAGIVSAWSIIYFQGTLHYGLGADQNKTPAHELLEMTLYVGLPEETAKLACFALFLPWLLLGKPSHSRAALTAGCVGLGFALDENLQYYMEGGVATAVPRLLTANFLHIAMTGLLGARLVTLIRTRFHSANDFLVGYACIVAAHGVYDFACGSTARELGMGMGTVIILALLTRYYLQELRPDLSEKPRQTISSTAVFVFGCSLVVGVMTIIAAIQGGDYKTIATVLSSAVGLVPVAYFYVREFQEV
jgi:RsiW-degrading membrane proteinase PrsW (M82 family)